MINYDDEFLARVGLGALTPPKKQIFLDYVREELEIRVGEKISENMSTGQLREFEGIMNKDPNIMRQFLSTLANYKEDGVFLKMIKMQGDKKIDANFVSDFLSVKWIQQNRPDYQMVVQEESEKLESEIFANKEAILAGDF